MRAIYTLDSLLATLPIVFMIFLIVFVLSIAVHNYVVSKYKSVVLKLVIASDVAVKYLTIGDSYKYINWVDVDRVRSYDWDALRDKLGLNDLYVGFSPKRDMVCIYRFCVVGEDKEIKRLFVCGD